MKRALGSLALLLAACGGDCDAAAIQAELDAASSGETVAIPACTVRGSLAVPAGVSLVGAGRDTTRIIGPTDGRAITLEPGAGTSLRDLSVESAGCAAIAAIGPGAISIERVSVVVSRGVGIGIDGATELTLDDVSAQGPLTPETADAAIGPLPPFMCQTSETATHGIVIVGVSTARLTSVRADGFAAFGVLSVRSGLEWSGGGASTTLGAHLEVWGGEAALSDLRFVGSHDGISFVQAFGAVFGGGATVTSRGLIVEGGDSFGLFHDGATGTHEDLTVQGNGFVGVWAQGESSVGVLGSSALEGNAFAAIAGIGSRSVMVDGASIGSTAEATRIVGVRTVRAADGVHLVDTDGALSNVTLASNARVGVLIDLAGGASSRVALTNVSVDGAGTALGAIAQNGTVAPGWDSGVSRLGATLTNDAAFAGTLDIAGAVGPVCLPPLDSLETVGIRALVGL